MAPIFLIILIADHICSQCNHSNSLIIILSIKLLDTGIFLILKFLIEIGTLILCFCSDTEKGDDHASGLEKIIIDMKPAERAALGYKCKRIIDMGRLTWLRKRGLNTQLVRYVPSSISPENYLLMAKPSNTM